MADNLKKAKMSAESAKTSQVAGLRKAAATSRLTSPGAPGDLLLRPLDALRGVSARRKALFHKMDIESCGDLLRFFPRAYEDWTDARPIVSFMPGEEVTFVAMVARQPSLFRKGRLTTLRSVLRDSSGGIAAVWFNQPYLEAKLQKGAVFLFRGKVKQGRAGLEIHNPALEEARAPGARSADSEESRFFDLPGQDFTGAAGYSTAQADDAQQGGADLRSFLKPLYPLTAGLTQGVVRMLVGELLDRLGGAVPEALPETIRKKRKLATAAFAYEQIHRPDSVESYQIARRRLAFEELFMLQLGLRILRGRRTQGREAQALTLNPERLQAYRAVLERLPFSLTKAQRRCLNEIAADIAQPLAMNRLVQGDVGSGKTVVAALAMLQAYLCGCQSAFLAPTAVLARQHFMTLSEQLAGSGARIELMLGQQSPADKKRLRTALEAGEIDLLVGTHALIEKAVRFKNLALAVTDEQHRFGVKQRLALGGEGELWPHVLVMSATPIPRSLGLILYGDLDISVLDEKPAGRQPIATYTAKSADDARIHALIAKRVQAGQQIYVICPLIKDEENVLSLESVEQTYEEYRDRIFPELKVGLMHGSLKDKEKAAIMQAFYAGEIQILVSTTVVEVGVDNPNASVMLIKNAERFGLAQLHQLRGRVGRGAWESICILQSDAQQGVAKERLDTLCRSDDGFEIAEADLKLRGPGDFFGTRQHGVPELRLANLYEDGDLLLESRIEVDELLNGDPFLEEPDHRPLWPLLDQYFGMQLQSPGL